MWQLGVLIPLLGAGTLRVTQEPGELQVTEGDTAALPCQVEVAEGAVLLRMEWLRGGGPGGLGGLGVLCSTRLRLDTPVPALRCPRRAPAALLAWHPPRATLSLPQARSSDSGRYLCRVTLEIPLPATATGDGTELRVTPASPGRHRTVLFWALLGGLGGLGGIVLLLGLALLCRRRCRRRSGAVHPDTAIYQNVGSLPARGPAKPPPPGPGISPYLREPQRPRGPPRPPRR